VLNSFQVVAIWSTSVSADLPSLAVLLQGRHLRGPLLPSNLVHSSCRPLFYMANFNVDRQRLVSSKEHALMCGFCPDRRSTCPCVHFRTDVSRSCPIDLQQAGLLHGSVGRWTYVSSHAPRHQRGQLSICGIWRCLASRPESSPITLSQQTPFLPTTARPVAPLIPSAPANTSAASLLPLSRPSTTPRAE
jgi:hypothetical protein